MYNSKDSLQKIGIEWKKSKKKIYLRVLAIVVPYFTVALLAADSLWLRSVDLRNSIPALSAIQQAMAFKTAAAKHGTELTVAFRSTVISRLSPVVILITASLAL